MPEAEVAVFHIDGVGYGFSSAMHDGIVERLDSVDGVFLAIPWWALTWFSDALEKCPERLPLVPTRGLANSIEVRHWRGHLLGVVDNLALGTFAKAQI